MTPSVDTKSDAIGAVLAVIVTYNPDIKALALSVRALNSQGCKTLIVDNGSLNQKEIVDEKLTAELICNTQNLGLGAAHNLGLAFGETRGYKYLLIMDQDSVPLDFMIERLVSAHKILSSKYKLSAVGACYLNSENQSESFFVRFGWLKFQREYANSDFVLADFLISSGSLFSIEALKVIGGMDEGLFIDHVDTEWFLRARSMGYSAYGVSDARMEHGLGEKTHTVKLGGRERNVPQHKPFRYYYIFRNSLTLYKRGYASWMWKWNDLQRLLMIFMMFGLLTSPRWKNMKMMLLGAWHGIVGKTGETEFHANR